MSHGINAAHRNAKEKPHQKQHEKRARCADEVLRWVSTVCAGAAATDKELDYDGVPGSTSSQNGENDESSSGTDEDDRGSKIRSTTVRIGKNLKQSDAQLVADVTSFMKANSLIQVQVGREARISQGVMSKWLSLKYRGDNDKVDAVMRAWLHARLAGTVIHVAPGGPPTGSWKQRKLHADMLPRSSDERWEANLAALMAFGEEHDGRNPSKRSPCTAERGLSSWRDRQRMARRGTTKYALSATQERRLQQMPSWSWGVSRAEADVGGAEGVCVH